MRRSSLFLLPLIALSLICTSCLLDDPAKLELGRDYNGTTHHVMDVTQSFKLNDPLVLQLDNGKNFGVDSVEMRLYTGTKAAHSASPTFAQKFRVKPTDRNLIVRGPVTNPIIARNFLKTNEIGSYFLEFTNGTQVITDAELSLHNSKE